MEPKSGGIKKPNIKKSNFFKSFCRNGKLLKYRKKVSKITKNTKFDYFLNM